MDASQWLQISRIYHAAVAQAESGRPDELIFETFTPMLAIRIREGGDACRRGKPGHQS
jgi:hypothetical protein